MKTSEPIFRHKKFSPYRRALELHARAADWIPERTQNHGLLMQATIRVALALADSVYEKEDRRALQHLERAEKFLRRAMELIEIQAYRLSPEHVEEALQRITALVLAIRALEKKPRATWLDEDPMPPSEVVASEMREDHERLLEIVAEIISLKQRVAPPIESRKARNGGGILTSKP